LVEIPKNKNVSESIWLYKNKHKYYISIHKLKVSFNFQGLNKIEGIDYDETFSPIGIYTTICVIIALVVAYRLLIYQMDVKTNLLNGFL